MRQTAKFKAAHALVQKLCQGNAKRLKSLLTMDHETLYETLLEDYSYIYDQGAWQQLTEEERSFRGGYASMFANRDGSASGVFALRIMAHPDDVPQLTKLLEKHFTLGRLTDPYPNRGGDGVRFYVTGRLPARKR